MQAGEWLKIFHRADFRKKDFFFWSNNLLKTSLKAWIHCEMCKLPRNAHDILFEGSRTISPEEHCPLDNCPPDNSPLHDCPLPPGLLSPGQLPPTIIAPKENCPPDNCHRGKFPPDNCSLDNCSWKIIPKIIGSWQYPPGNIPRVPFRWFVA